MAYSGWQYAQIIQGGESFVALSEGLQNALFACGGAPKQHRTDSLSAAYRNGGKRSRMLTQLYEELCQHYRLQPTRNNRGIAHENGSIESPHGHLKNRIEQALLLRGSFEFASIREYQAVIDAAINGLNVQCQQKFEQEQAALQPLPVRRVPDYELISAKVSSRSTIEVRRVLYTQSVSQTPAPVPHAPPLGNARSRSVSVRRNKKRCKRAGLTPSSCWHFAN